MKRFLIFATLSIIGVLSFASLVQDLDTTAELVRIEQKMLGIIFTTADCPYCTALKEDVLTDERVSLLIRSSFHFVEVGFENPRSTGFFGEEMNYDQLFSYLNIRAVPTIWFFTSEGTSVGYLPGYADADVFTKVLAYVYQELDEDFQSYLKREDNFRGEQKLINVSKDEAEYVLNNDSNSALVSAVPDVFDPYVVYVTADELVAQKLVELGAFRVLLF